MSSASALPPGGKRSSAWSSDIIEQKIYLIRGHKVMLDADLAVLYGVETRALVQAVKRNRSRFPSDFVVRLTTAESEQLRSQTVISNTRGGRRYAPYAFTEQGVAMLSSVLRSHRGFLDIEFQCRGRSGWASYARDLRPVLDSCPARATYHII